MSWRQNAAGGRAEERRFCAELSRERKRRWEAVRLLLCCADSGRADEMDEQGCPLEAKRGNAPLEE